jgi:PAS domain S-box-containing protein
MTPGVVSLLVVGEDPAGMDLGRELVQAAGGLQVEVTRVAPAEAAAAVRNRTWDAVLVSTLRGDTSLAETVHRVREASPRVALVVLGAGTGDGAADASLPDADCVLSCQETTGREVLRAARGAAEHRRLVNTLKAREERFRNLVNAVDDMVTTVDVMGRFTGLWGPWARKVGMHQEGFLGKTGKQVLGDEAGKIHDEAVMRALRGERAVCQWVWGAAPEARHMETRFSPVWGTGDRVSELVAVSRDVTELHALQAQVMQSDRLASMGTLAQGVAHEINNPLAAVLANLSFCSAALDRGAAPDAEFRDALSDAWAGAEMVRRTVRDLKVFSRPEEEVVRPVDVRATLESALRMAWTEVRHRARVEKRLDLVPAVVANQARLAQVFLNLIVNAAQSLPDGQVDHHVIVLSTSVERGGHVVVEVRDSGPGMTAEAVGRLFDPFVSTSPAGLGEGLGLTLCHRVVRALGGDISVNSEVGKGTCVRLRLPATQAPVHVTPLPMAACPPPRRGRVLAIDDDVAILRAIKRTLGPHHDVTTMNNPREALALLLSGTSFDVILCDLMMPEMTGPDLHAKLREAAPSVADGMVFLTGGAFSATARGFLDGVPNKRLEKPFDVDLLRDLVASRVR